MNAAVDAAAAAAAADVDVAAITFGGGCNSSADVDLAAITFGGGGNSSAGAFCADGRPAVFSSTTEHRKVYASVAGAHLFASQHQIKPPATANARTRRDRSILFRNARQKAGTLVP
jgi:hypothetical protein